MANPQKEKGHTRIANELYDAVLAWRFSSYEQRVLMFIIRKTYGWNKKSDKIALSQFVKATGIRKSHVSRALSLLLKQNVITKGGNRDLREWGLQKDYDKWVKLPKGVKSHHPIGITKGGNMEIVSKGVIDSVKGGNSKRKRGGIQKTLTKDTITKDKRGDKSPAPVPSKIAVDFFKGIKDLIEKIDSPEASQGRIFLEKLLTTYPLVPKEVLWREVKKFYNYWTEPTPSGKRQLWQKRETFNIPRRLQTWFSRVKEFEDREKVGFIKNNRGKDIII